LYLGNVMNPVIYSLLENTLKLCITNISNTSLFIPDIIQNLLIDNTKKETLYIPSIDKSIIKLIKHIRKHTDMNKIYKMCIKLKKKVKKNNLLKPILLDCINTMIFIIRSNLKTIHKLEDSNHKLEDSNQLKSAEILKLQNDVEFWKKSKSSVQLNQSNDIMLEIVPIYE
jgi:hypothetical protein